MDNDIFFRLPLEKVSQGTDLPVNRCDETVFIRQLQRINDTENFLRISAGGSRIVNDGADNFFRIDEEDRSDGKCHSLGVDIRSILIIDHVVKISDFAGFISDNGESKRRA